MKVTLPENYKDIYTLTELTMAKAVISCMKEDSYPIKEYADMAAREALKNRNRSDYVRTVLTATAQTYKNNRIEWNGMCGGSGYFDVWIDFIAETGSGFIKGGAYLSDIFGIGAVDIYPHMYIHYYTEH